MASEQKPENSSLITNFEWMIRPCEMYKDEYNECTSIKGRFHQYFIYGETLDCSQWKRDYDNCYKWKDDNDIKAGTKIIESEQVRRQERLRSHYANNIWEKRDKPPADWNKELPEYISKDYENTFLGQKALEMRGDVPIENSIADRTLCVII